MILKYPHIAQPAQFWPLILSWVPLNNGDGDILEAQVVQVVQVVTAALVATVQVRLIQLRSLLSVVK